MGRTQEPHEEVAMVTIDTSGGGASKRTNSTITEVVGVNDDEYDDMAYFKHLGAVIGNH